MVYLDYNATTPLAPEALETMLPFLHGGYGNPSSIHAAGREARAGIDDAREKLAALLGVKGHEIIFTGGGTEACNLGVLGIARAHLPRGRHLITTATEHHAVLHACQHLLHHEGYELTILPVDASGRVDPQDVARAIRADTTVVSVMHANNETGVLQPIEEISALCRERKVFFHTDAVQTFGKIPVRPAELGAAAVSIAGHKFYGPKGVGALYLRSGIATARTLHGGAQENTRRPGTENVAAIVGMVAAAEKALAAGIADQPRQAALRDRLWAGIQEVEPRAIRNGAADDLSLGNTLNVSFPGVDGEALLIGLDLEGVCVSSGSACMVGSVQPSHVLIAMGVAPAVASSTVRFSLGLATTEADIDHCLRALASVLARQAAFAAA
ncbi:cysteine desulfurase [Terrimicrobium sacchariphilum]|uniref:cysteine desulfurase n=1 Tax=Terrimicrobium sacchariphilum TaxID=690879 RepID=A0A146GAV5_TERSA|nr:cysteine desulfurase family protein [Terrimicrobium sacchariphilum]GAT34541.1 cysteine desulfurase [Terrimicrobium sacchariphilum]